MPPCSMSTLVMFLVHVRVGYTHGGHACPAWGAAQRCAVGVGPRSDAGEAKHAGGGGEDDHLVEVLLRE